MVFHENTSIYLDNGYGDMETGGLSLMSVYACVISVVSSVSGVSLVTW